MPGTAHDEGLALAGELAGLVRLARAALSGATTALTKPDGTAEGVPAAEKALAELRDRIEEDATEAPEGCLALVLGVHVGTEVEGLAQLAQRLLAAAWARQGRELFPERVRAPLSGLADSALNLVGQAADVLTAGTPEGVADLLAGLYEPGQRQRLLYELLLADPAPADRADTTDLALLSCYYQQCAGHAASIARHAVLFSGALT